MFQKLFEDEGPKELRRSFFKLDKKEKKEIEKERMVRKTKKFYQKKSVSNLAFIIQENKFLSKRLF